MNRTTATFAAALAIAGTALTTLPASASGFPACTARQLHLTLGHERANTGHVSFTVTAANRGPACVLSGFPRLGLLDGHRNPLHSSVTRTGKAGSVLVLNGLTAQAGVSYGTDGAFGTADAAYLTVGGKALRMSGWVYGGQLTVTTWTTPNGKA
jgi:hypothetical protein